MSLEVALQENTAAVRALHELMARLALPHLFDAAMQAAADKKVDAAPTEAAEKPKAEDMPIRKRTPKDAPAETPVETPATEVEAKKPAATQAAEETKPAAGAAAAESPSEEATYDDVKAITIAMSKKSRDMAVGALAHFNVARASELKAEQYGAFVAHAKNLMGAA